ncbi:MAG: FCD domain-containing protein [Sphingomonas taxi]
MEPARPRPARLDVRGRARTAGELRAQPVPAAHDRRTRRRRNGRRPRAPRRSSHGSPRRSRRCRRAALDNPEGQAADQAFHNTILEATGNELLVSLSGSIGAAVRWTTIFKFRGSRRPRDSMPQHRRLLDAIATGDAATARDATIVLVQQAHEDTERLLRG